jgi:hypothetical protein
MMPQKQALLCKLKRKKRIEAADVGRRERAMGA